MAPALTYVPWRRRHQAVGARALTTLLACLALSVGLDIGLAAQEPAVAEQAIDTAPVEVDGQVLFHVRGASSMAPEIRAERIRQRVETVAADASVRPEAIRVAEMEGLTWIMAGDRPIMAVTEADARLEQLTRTELAATHLARLRQAVAEYRAARTPEAMARSIRTVAVATLGVLLALGVIALLNRWMHKLAARAVDRRVQAVQIQRVALVRAERIVTILHQALQLATAIAVLAVVFQYLAFGLGAFPATRYLANHLFSIAVAPLKTMAQSAIDQVPNLVFLAVLAVVVRMGLRVLRVVFDAVERGAIRFSAFEPEWAQPTYKIVRFAIVAFAVVVAYPYMPGSQSAAFKGVSLFVGVLFSLGSSSAVANLIAGYMLIYRRAFKLGDRVQIGDVMGDVTESRIQVTRLRTVKNEEIVIPNSQILAAQVTNYSALARTQGLILHTMVGIGYETPWRQVEAMLLIGAARTPGILRSPAPFVLQRALADFAVNYELNVYCEDAGRMLDVYTDLHRQILDVFNEYGVQIMTPAYRFDPAEPKIVPPSQWHLAPAAPPPPATATTPGPIAT